MLWCQPSYHTFKTNPLIEMFIFYVPLIYDCLLFDSGWIPWLCIMSHSLVWLISWPSRTMTCYKCDMRYRLQPMLQSCLKYTWVGRQFGKALTMGRDCQALLNMSTNIWCIWMYKALKKSILDLLYLIYHIWFLKYNLLRMILLNLQLAVLLTSLGKF